MNLDIYRLIELIFFHINMSICIGWDKMDIWTFEQL